MKSKAVLGCNYAGYEFGAHYPDSQCIDGVLWDMDACDGSGNLYEPMTYIPCPKCNTQAWLDNFRWEFINDGACAGSDGAPFNKIRTVPIPAAIRNVPGAFKKDYPLAKTRLLLGIKKIKINRQGC
ncbi:hypothetical protein [Morganella morganii]|uniref:hypothetical protein n=1 Tax=Morganella morganii TaxID=582 RepID=UPI0030FEE447